MPFASARDAKILLQQVNEEIQVNEVSLGGDLRLRSQNLLWRSRMAQMFLSADETSGAFRCVV
jgi:hypothetical protein